MANLEYVTAAFVNVVATPHPEGVYLRLFKKAARKVVQYWGDYHAAIVSPSKIAGEEDFYSFQLLTWVEIDPGDPTINKSVLEKESFPREGRAFSNQFGVNGRVFYCVLDTKKHLLTVELKNDDGQTISAGRVEMIFRKLLSPKILGVDSELVDVTIIPQDDALEYVLGFARLDRVDILVKRPNSDDITSATNRILADLTNQNAKSKEVSLTRAPATDGLELSEENETLAQVGAHNGRVDSKGLDEYGEKCERSTKEKPKIVKRIIEKGASYFGALRIIAKEARENKREL